MNALYWLRPPSEGAQAPRRWSYSSLSLWRSCPLRWWLTNSRYDNAPGGTYPPVFGAPALQGRVVHAALEALCAHLKQSGQAFDARRFMKSRLREILSTEVAANPRIDAGRLESGFSLDECMRKFFSLAVGLTGAPRPNPPAGAPRHPPQGPPEEDAELWVEVDDPPLAGQIDRVTRGGIVDFKTGEADPDAHAEQLRIYAVLWWLRFKARPASLSVRYADSQVEVEVPTEDELGGIADALRAEVAAARGLLSAPPPPARPSSEACRHCPVRQLCGAYWTSPDTLQFRAPTAEEAATTVPLFRDVRLMALPGHWQGGQPCQGTAQAENIGPVVVNLSARNAPASDEPMPRAARILQSLLVRDGDGWTLRQTSATEVFWEVQCEADATC